ncbi:MAG: class I SAM-dependent methyltransferase [Terriglobales bacterium]
MTAPASQKQSPAPPSHPKLSAWSSYWLFYSQFRHHFHATGAIAPSSGALAAQMTAPLAAAAGRRRLAVLEVGAGTGVFTRAILERLRDGDRLEVCEINRAFQPVLEARLEEAKVEQRGITCALHYDDICAWPDRPTYDFIISGLPLNNFSPELVERILTLFAALLLPGGVLSYFEYLFIRKVKFVLVGDSAERARLRAIGAVVERFMSQHASRAVPVALNFPPAMARHVWAGGAD